MEIEIEIEICILSQLAGSFVQTGFAHLSASSPPHALLYKAGLLLDSPSQLPSPLPSPPLFSLRLVVMGATECFYPLTPENEGRVCRMLNINTNFLKSPGWCGSVD